jgi:hypothetical protein
VKAGAGRTALVALVATSLWVCAQPVRAASSRFALGSPSVLAEILGGASPQVAVSAKGDAVAAWVRYPGPAIEAATRPAGGAWTSPLALSAGDGSAQGARVAIGDKGKAVAVWYRYTDTGSSVQAATWTAGGGWSAPSTLSAATGWAYLPDVAIDGQGDAVVVWYRYTGTGFSVVESATQTASGGWSPPGTVSRSDGWSEDPHVAAGGKGKVVAVWHRQISRLWEIEASTRSAGGDWSAPNALRPTTGTYGLQVGVSDNGDGLAVWTHGSALEAATGAVGGSWSSPGSVSPSFGTQAAAVRLAVGGKGDAVALWTRYADGAYVVEAVTRSASGTWSMPSTLSTSANWNAQVAIADTGDAVAVWPRVTGNVSVVEVAVRPANGGWSAPVRLSASDGSAYDPEVAIGGNRHGVAVWMRNTASGVVVEAASTR